MTLEEFETLLKPRGKLDFMFTAEDGMRLAEAVANLDEKQRKKLSKTASQFYQQARKQANASNDAEFATIAVLAVCPLGEARKLRWVWLPRQEPAAIKILVDRRPEWLGQWLDRQLAEEFPRITWHFVRELIEQGACQKPTSDGYIRLMAWHVGNPHQVPRSDRLLAEPDLLDDLWRLFEVETQAFMWLGTSAQAPTAFEDWPATLLLLARQGHLDRQRLLASCLRAINSEFSNNAISGFIHLHERLELTADEIAAGQPTYLKLLGSRKSHVVKFALDVLSGLEKEGRLDGEAFLAGAKGVFGLKPKGQPKTALSLAARLAKRRPELIPQAANLAVEALTHESVDVQEQAAGLLEAWLDRLHRDYAAEIRERAGGLSATIRSWVEAIIARLEGVAATRQPVSERSNEARESPSDTASDLTAQAAALPDRWRRLAGVDEALTALVEGRLPAAVLFDLLDVPLLTSVEPIAPIQTVDELLDAVAHAVEQIESADELERILDGISRLCDQRPADFDLRAAPLVKRLDSAEANAAMEGLLAVHPMLRRLVLTWLVGQRPAMAAHYEHERSLMKFVQHRLSEIEDRVVRRQTAPLLAAPTHRWGWIDPLALVRRLLDWQRGRAAPPPADLIQALLRLAPDGRRAALVAAEPLPGNTGRAVRWALGSDVGPTAADHGDFSLWLAAGRARDPGGELAALAPLINPSVSDWLLPPTYACQTAAAPEGYHYRPAGAVDLKVSVFPQFASSPALQMRPTLAFCEPSPYGHHAAACTAWGFGWLAMVWPLHGDPFFASGIQLLLGRVNAGASAFEPNYVFLQPLLAPDRPWSELAYLAEWIALVSKDPGSRGAAVDALVTAIEDGRADTRVAAQVLGRLLPAGWVKLNRVADVGREIGRAGPLHAFWTAQMLQAFVAAAGEWPADMHHVLSLLLELLSDLEMPLEATAREKLSFAKATGKAAKTIARLTALPECKRSSKAHAALRQAVESRLARAQRWAGE